MLGKVSYIIKHFGFTVTVNGQWSPNSKMQKAFYYGLLKLIYEKWKNKIILIFVMIYLYFHWFENITLP